METVTGEERKKSAVEGIEPFLYKKRNGDNKDRCRLFLELVTFFIFHNGQERHVYFTTQFGSTVAFLENRKPRFPSYSVV